ncbi:GFA family protein [Pseudooceanicola sediminis]|uniref:GFA family protein n=1 Tax=Pseudooceanicola sediminis TaxID=2211117 RepID=A0A399IZ37_9RHOB|nr:GFA family protein [Pseudooceanicola sediminis]KAA2313396.1 GFA family protein [Puniceibacterium sp. HSS470]RII38325.1 GFA family protein [Pseudooceanicola sediminis]|tara:strand:+ start:52352 stop:52729 length:378 start_codon:yes stop_codon:yes gene_type:complete
MLKGSCLCGGIAWTTRATPRDSIACHCTQCRKTSGHYWSATQVPTADLEITRADTLTWYQSSPRARRGFCNTCGSSIFWQMEGEGTTSIGSGTIDGGSGLTTSEHIYCASKGDYYDIEAGPAKSA